MSRPTNSLVASLKKFALPAGSAAAALAVSGALLLTHSSSVHAASAAALLDDNSVSSLVSLDNAVEAVAARVTPAVVNVSVTARVGGQNADGEEDGQDSG